MKFRFVRPPVRCSILFSSNRVSGAGRVLDLSERGCRVTCDKPVPEGAEVILRISPSEGAAPINVDLAIVGWAKGQEFGLVFRRIRPEARERLSRFVKEVRGKPRR